EYHRSAGGSRGTAARSQPGRESHDVPIRRLHRYSGNAYTRGGPGECHQFQLAYYVRGRRSADHSGAGCTISAGESERAGGAAWCVAHDSRNVISWSRYQRAFFRSSIAQVLSFLPARAMYLIAFPSEKPSCHASMTLIAS